MLFLVLLGKGWRLGLSLGDWLYSGASLRKWLWLLLFLWLWLLACLASMTILYQFSKDMEEIVFFFVLISLQYPL